MALNIPKKQGGFSMSSKKDSSKNIETTVEMEKKMTWKTGYLLSLGVPVLVLTAIGPIALQTGSASVVIWVVTVLIGFIQTLVYADYSLMFKEKSGGFAVCAADVYKKYFPKLHIIRPFISWGYWLGWSPVLAINLLIVGMYVNKLFIPGVNPVIISAVLLIIQGVLASYGIKFNSKAQLLLGVLSVGPLLALGFVPFFTGQVNFANIFPLKPISGSWLSAGFIILFLGNAMSAAWCDYATETVCCYTSEYMEPEKDLPKAIISAGVTNIIIYLVVPFSLLGVLGLKTISQDPYIALVTAAQMVFGKAGSWVVAIMLISALLMSANTALCGCSRTLYQMALDGNIVKQFGKLNKHNEPIVALVFNICLNLGLMCLGNPMFILVASSIGFTGVVPIVQVSYFYLRGKEPNRPRPFAIPNIFKYISLVFAVWNVAILVAGCYSYGLKNFLTGAIILLLCVPFYYYRKVVQDKVKLSDLGNDAA